MREFVYEIEYEILEIDAADLFAVFYCNCLVHLPLRRIRAYWIEMDGLFLDSPLPYTVHNCR